jgi:protein-S-isoprenylcysteine O-methyltransferase Ste14
VVTGLYRYVRNPMYVALLAIIFGEALLFGDVRLAVYGTLFWLASHLYVLLYEERQLRRKFGAQYDAFRAGVPRWIPRITPWQAT